MKEILRMTDPTRHESYLAFEGAFQDAQQKTLASCEILAKQLQKVHESVRDLSLLVDAEKTNREEQWRSGGERLEQFRKALAEGLGIADGEKTRIAELEAALSEQAQARARAEQRLGALERDHGELVASSGAARERVISLEKLGQQARERIAALEGEVSRLEEAARAYQAEHAAAQAQAAEDRETAARLTVAEQEAAQARVAKDREAAARLTAAEQEAATLREALATARAAGEKGDQAIQALTHDLAQTRAEAAQWQEKAQAALASAEETIPDVVLAPEDGSAFEAGEPGAGAAKAAVESAARPPKPEPAADTKEASVRAEGGGERTRFGRRPLIGQLLLDAQVITAAQLEEAIAEQTENTSRHLGDILIEKGYADEEAIAQVLAAQCQTEFCRLGEQPVDSEAVALVNERLAQQHTCIAIRANGGTLVLAMANPMNLLAIEDIERATSRKVEVMVATPSDIKEAIAKFYWEPE